MLKKDSHKRRISGSNNDEPFVKSLKNRTKVDGLWFQDGNLVLATTTHQFRIFRGILEQNSLFFQTMFTLPQPVESTDSDLEYLDGAPILYVDDHWQDMELFLKVFLSPG